MKKQNDITDGGKCTSCGKFKKWTAFYKNKRHITGYTYSCKICELKKSKIRRDKIAKGLLIVKKNFVAPSNAQMNEEWRLFKLKSREMILTSNYSSVL